MYRKVHPSQDYQLDSEHRNRINRQIERERLAEIARSGSETGFNLSDAIQQHHRLLIAIIIAVLFVVAQLVLPRAAAAADQKATGDLEPFADAITQYRVGHYHFIVGDYDKAVDEYQYAIASIPQDVIAATNVYWVMYWDLGDAQFMAGQPENALESYQSYLKLADDSASNNAVAFVSELESRIANGTVGTMTILEG